MEDIKKESKDPIAFTAVGKPLTKQQLYKDLKGQPNQFAVRPGDKPGEYKFNFLGSSMAYGLYTGIDYRF